MRSSLNCLVLIAIGWCASILLADEQPTLTAEAEKLFAQFDKDNDGLVRGEEVPENRRPLFYRLIRFGDKDNSGALTKDEFTKAYAEQKPRRAEGEADDASDQRPRIPDFGQLFKRLDVNSDGKIEESEIPAGRRELIDRLGKKADKNGDGAIDREEFDATVAKLRQQSTNGPKPEQLFKKLDADKDGKLTLEEVPQDRRGLFKRISAQADKDGDKALSEEEFVAGIKAARAAIGEQIPGLDGLPVDPEKMAARLMRLDKNGDGKISRDEFDRPGDRRFEQLDTNHDGAVDAEEIKAQADSVAKKLDEFEKNKKGTESKPESKPQKSASNK
jgi:Ca2+-binding EF-hand superfamily protein